MKKEYNWSHSGRESLKIAMEIDSDEIKSVRIKAVGCLSFLKMSQEMKKVLKGKISELPLPKGVDHSSLIWKEMVTTIQEEWQLPVTQDELCHCRKVSTAKVDHAVVYGAHSINDIRARTSANTGCGTCREDVLSLINYRLKNS